jgi:molybdopterin converting factor small subunit
MEVTVNFLGILADYFKTPKAQLELPDKATVKDLLQALGKHFGGHLPKRLWDHTENRFVVGVHIAGKNGDLNDPDLFLAEGDEIHILMPIAGGKIS